MNSTYTPQPGTITARAVAHLKKQPPGTVLTSAQLAEALHLDDSKTIYPSMVTAVRHGIVHQDYKADDRRILLWSLGNGKSIDLIEDDEDDSGPLNSTPPEIPRVSSIWPGLATPPADTRSNHVIASERAWESGHQPPHRGKTPNVERRPNRATPPPTGDTPVPTTRKKGLAPMEYADIDSMQITNDPVIGRTNVAKDKYSALFERLKLGQSIKCQPADAPKVANAMRKWVKDNKIRAAVRAVRKYPADGLGRVWLLANEPAKKAA